jgi:exodeoxyribonuclease-3
MTVVQKAMVSFGSASPEQSKDELLFENQLSEATDVLAFAARREGIVLMRIVSWNVNGLRACTKKGFLEWFHQTGADIVGLQEVRARLDQLEPAVAQPDDWHMDLFKAERPGYSGVALYSRTAPDSLSHSLDRPEFDMEGRVQIARFGALTVANIDFPNGSGKNRDNSRVSFKLDFYRTLFDRLEADKQAGSPIVVIGDFNTAHCEIDLARPKNNHGTSGFLPEERDELDRWLREGWVDSFRQFHSEEGHYTWWSNRFGVRERNIGWRIDYALVSPGALPYLQDSTIFPDVMGSDHCPIQLTLDSAILSAG